MRSGYSHALVQHLAKAKTDTPAVALGRLCVTHGVPVRQLADSLGVSRQTVYNWFWGHHAPSADQARAILALVAQLSTKKQAVPA